MKKMLVALLMIIIICIIKYYISDYNIKYSVDGYEIKTIYKDDRFYFEIKKDIVYNFDLYQKRKLNKVNITKIKETKIDKNNCIIPYVNNKELYPLCYDFKNKNLINYNLLQKNNETEKEYKNDFEFNKNLNPNEYVAFWNYKGYIIMNGNKYNNVNLFENDRYDNNLSILIDNYIYMPNYDQSHEFDEMIKLDIETLKYEKIKLSSKIDFDSYVVGNIKKNIYIFDNKKEILYEINKNNGKTEEKSNNEIGYVKYKNNKFINCSKYEYKTDKITYNNKEQDLHYNYIEKDGIYKVFNENKKLKTKIINEKVKVIYEYKDFIYYVYDNKLFSFNEKEGSKVIFYNYELNFNNNNTIFIYIK